MSRETHTEWCTAITGYAVDVGSYVFTLVVALIK